MSDNKTVGLSLEDQAQALAYKCRLTEKCPAEFLTDGYCPKGIYGLDMPFGKDCLCYVVKDEDWLEYLATGKTHARNSNINTAQILKKFSKYFKKYLTN